MQSWKSPQFRIANVQNKFMIELKFDADKKFYGLFMHCINLKQPIFLRVLMHVSRIFGTLPLERFFVLFSVAKL